jgi:hypothetical protein
VVAVVTALVLTACGAGTGEPGEDIGTDVPLANATTAPAAPAPQEFVERAERVAEAVRHAGVPTVPHDPVLLSNWALDESFDTGDQKAAWNNGQVTLAPGALPQSPGAAAMRLPDGTTRRVGLVDVRAALDRALSGALDHPAPCNGVAAQECRVVVSRAALVRVPVSTTAGQATVPAWRLTVDGLSHSISVLAMEDGALPRPQPRDPLPEVAALPDASVGLAAADSLRRVDGATIEVGLASGGCSEGLSGHAVEADDMVVVGGTTPPPPPNQACPAYYQSRTVLLRLSRPLGARPVIDVESGRQLLAGVPPF